MWSSRMAAGCRWLERSKIIVLDHIQRRARIVLSRVDVRER